jgi:aminoglycoside phosphotransferase (APT) family kinase protein
LVSVLDDESISLRPFRGGVDYFVDLVHRAGHADTVVRSAVVERIETSYEGWVDFADVLEREVEVVKLLAAAGVAVPEVLRWHRGDPPEDPSWMLSRFIAHDAFDDVPLSAHRALGRLARRIHDIEPTGDARALLAPAGSWSEWVVRRIARRVDAARRYVDLPEQALVLDALRRAVGDRDRHARSLLHLDLRGPNLAVEGDDVVAVFDFANAIVGDPFLELARVDGCGLLTGAFLEGYGLRRDELEAHRALLLAYGLDLQALLVVVSREEFDDPMLHESARIRTVDALTALVG